MEAREFAQNLLKKVRDYQPGRTDRGDFRRALTYIMELTEDTENTSCTNNMMSLAEEFPER